MAAAEAHVYSLGADKVLKLSYTVAAAAPAAAGAAAAEVTVTVRVEPKSSKKTVDWVDVIFGPATAPAGGPAEAALVPGRAPVGAAAGSVRLAAALKERLPGKARAGKAALVLAVADFAGPSAALAATLRYAPAGGGAPVELPATLRLRAAAMLLPVPLAPDAYKALMTGPDAETLTHATVALPASKDAPAAKVLDAAVAVLRAHAVARKPGENAILYATTAAGAHVTAALKVAGDAVSATVKAATPGLAAILAADLAEVVQELAGEAKDE